MPQFGKVAETKQLNHCLLYKYLIICTYILQGVYIYIYDMIWIYKPTNIIGKHHLICFDPTPLDECCVQLRN